MKIKTKIVIFSFIIAQLVLQNGCEISLDDIQGDEDAGNDTDSEADTDTGVEPDTDTVIESDTDTVIESDTDTVIESDTDTAVPVIGAPVLAFSDLTNGPDTGLRDGLGVGTIVTVWGWNLGSSQGLSQIYFVDSASVSRQAAHVYYWKNADGLGASGPANLYKFHKMQEIAFSLPDGADGAGRILVNVAGKDSNELEFFVNDGVIHWAKSTGNDATGNGSWENPWATLGYMKGATTRANEGDIIYGYDISESVIAVHGSYDGSENNLIGLVSYPGHPINVTDGGVGAWGIADHPAYWTFAKLHITTTGSGISPTEFGRVVGNYIWDGPAGSIPRSTGCADGSGGAIVASLDHSGSKIFGNHIYDFGCYDTSNQHHTTYLSSRDQPTLGRIWNRPLKPYEFAWNFLDNNHARGGLHDYDEHGGNGYDTSVVPLYVHHNVFVNQVSASINLGFLIPDSDRWKYGDWDIYSNLIVRSGQSGTGGAEATPKAIHLYGEGIPQTASFSFSNNTIAGYGQNGQSPGGNNGAIHIWDGNLTSWGIVGTWEWKNNIVFDTLNFPYNNVNYQLAPVSKSNNLFFSSGGTPPTPAWAEGCLTSDPLFTDPDADDYSLQTNSPALNGGTLPTDAPYSKYGVDGTILTKTIGAFGSSGQQK